MRHLFTIATLLTSLSLVAQVPTKMNVHLRTYLQRVQGSGTPVHLFLRGDEGAMDAAVRAVGGTVKYRMEGLVSATVPEGDVVALIGQDCVQGVEFSLFPGIAMNDSARVHNRINPVHQGAAPLVQGYTGAGVVVGVVDQGCDWRHGDFQLPNGDTRILKFWGQTYGFDAQLTPQPYNYGQAWDSTHINNLQCPASDQPGTFGHGSTVTGAAAGDGSLTGNCKGVAPDADIIVVSNGINMPNWTNTVVDGVQYIFEQAQSMGKPAVVNLSLGSYLGSHDGQDAAALMIDDLLNAAPGRVVVCAAGNSGNWPAYHTRTNSDNDTAFTWYLTNNQSFLGYPAVYFDVWGDSAEMVNLQYALGANLPGGSFADRGRTNFHDVLSNAGVQITEPIVNPDGDTLAVVDYFAEQRGGQYHVEVHVAQPDSSALYWRFMTVGNGAHDGWAIGGAGWLSGQVTTGLPDAVDFPSIAHYVFPDSLQSIVTSWACSPNVITVANYHNEEWYIGAHQDTVFVTPDEGSRDPGSSSGPTRTGLLKPDVGATGSFTFSPGPLSTMAAMLNQPGNVWKMHPDSLHMRNSGTSMASPVVTGVAALYLEKCPNAPHNEVIAAIQSNAYADQWTGILPNVDFGYGKVDGFATLAYGAPSTITAASTEFCDGDSVLVQGPVGLASYAWSNGSSDPQVYVSAPGGLSLAVDYGSGCTATSDTLVFVEHPAPAAPVITLDGVTLESTSASSYQWIFNGNEIPGATDQTYDPTVNGDYQVLIADGNGCTAISDTLFFGSAAVAEMGNTGFGLWPSPTTGMLNVHPPTGLIGPVSYEVHDEQGRVVAAGPLTGASGPRTVQLPRLAKGLYALRLTDGNAVFVQRFTYE